ncbi:MAG: hypothetical protein M3R63_01915 [Actinomycetota bacterium]|nr:hypothetical protein [Actinomycetota bacterium]
MSPRVAGEDFELDAGSVERAVADIDRADFTTHQARSILRRLGFGVHRRGHRRPPPREGEASTWPHGGAEAAALEPHLGRWIAQAGHEVLYDADSPYDVVRWLRQNGLRARVWKIPATPDEAGSMLSHP